MKKKSLFNDGVLDIHFIDIDNVADDNMSIYEDMIYEAINYAENNKLTDVYLPGEYINMRDSSTYDADLADIISTLNSMAFKFTESL